MLALVAKAYGPLSAEETAVRRQEAERAVWAEKLAATKAAQRARLKAADVSSDSDLGDGSEDEEVRSWMRSRRQKRQAERARAKSSGAAMLDRGIEGGLPLAAPTEAEHLAVHEEMRTNVDALKLSTASLQRQLAAAGVDLKKKE